MLTLEELKRAREGLDPVWVAYLGKVRSGTLLWVRGHPTKRGTERELHVRFPGELSDVSFWDEAVFSSEVDALRHWEETLKEQQTRVGELLKEARARIGEIEGHPIPETEESAENPGAKWGFTKEQVDGLREACIAIKDFLDIISPVLLPLRQQRRPPRKGRGLGEE